MGTQRSGFLTLLRPTHPEVNRVVSHCAIHAPSAALPERDRDAAADSTSTDRQGHRQATLKYLILDVSNFQHLELPDPSEPIATGTAVEVT